MISFIYRTDVHASDHSPASWKGDYPTEIWSNLRQIGELAKKHKALAVLDGGDFFHRKAPSKNSHGLIVKTSEIHKKYPCPTFSIEGNHDIVYNDLESVPAQPLGVLYSTGVFNHLSEEVFESEGKRVRVVGLPFSENRCIEDFHIEKKPEDDFLIVIAHALASEVPPSTMESFFGEPVFKYSDLLSENGPDIFMFGHWHRDQGAVQLGKTWFVNQGAVSRGSLTHENMERNPNVALIELDQTARVTILPLVVQSASEVYDLERKERAETEAKSIDVFLEALSADSSFDPDKTIEVNINGMEFAKEVRDLALEYLELRD